MDDISEKSDDELRSIMRSSVANQYVPGSIYHRAKQELEFRKEMTMENDQELNMTERAVLRSLSKSKIGTDVTGKFITIEILEHQFGEQQMPKVIKALDRLTKLGLIEEVEDSEDVFRLTPYGGSYLDELKLPNSVTYSNVTNSNISHQSQHVNQMVNISELPEDIQKNLEELRVAASKRDASGMKRAFAYIADKAVDVAIAITLGHLKL